MNTLKAIRAQLLFLLFSAVVVFAFAILAGYFSNQTVSEHWDAYVDEVEARHDTLARINDAMGYGGMIHHFKNYVIRAREGDSAKRIQAFYESYDEVGELIARYRTYHGLTAGESKALDGIQATADAYKERFAIARQLIAQGESLEAIDAVVKIDDTLAFKSFAYLDREINGLATAMTQDIDREIDLAQKVSLSAFAIGVLLILLVGIAVTRSVAKSAAEIRARELEAREARKVAEASEKAKDDFLANVSHELRTPLNAMIGVNDLLEESELDAEQRRLLNLMHSAAWSQLELVNDLLDFSTIAAGNMKLRTSVFDLSSLTQTVVGSVREGIGNKQVAFDVENHEGLPRYVLGDGARVRQVLMNLLGNAVKFTQEGRIELRAFPVDDSQPDVIRFEVEDSGIGISADRIGVIFDRFVQADASTKRAFGGTGLGLAIVKQLVELMGGYIGVESEEGKGSTFWIEIPLARAEPPQELRAELAMRDQSNSNGSRGTDGTTSDRQADALVPVTEEKSTEAPAGGSLILLAEDNPTNQLVAKSLIQKLGHRVECASNGREALELLPQHLFELVLMDCQMPEMDGYEATGEIRRREAEGSSRIPVIALTANAMKGDREKCLAAGMDDYLTKPISMASLKSMLDTHLVSAEESS